MIDMLSELQIVLLGFGTGFGSAVGMEFAKFMIETFRKKGRAEK